MRRTWILPSRPKPGRLSDEQCRKFVSPLFGIRPKPSRTSGRLVEEDYVKGHSLKLVALEKR